MSDLDVLAVAIVAIYIGIAGMDWLFTWWQIRRKRWPGGR